MNQRAKLGMVTAEFLGTATLTSVILAQINATGAIITSPWFVGLSAGLTLAVMVLAIGRISGCHLNPAVTVAMWSLRKIPTTNAIVYIASQILGGAVALILFQYLADNSSTTVAGPFDWRVFVAEVVGTAVFTFGIASVVYQKLTGFEASFTIGVSLFLGIVIASTAGNGIINPAVALGLDSWSLTYVFAPVIGAIAGMNTYAYLVAFEKMPTLKSHKSKKRKK